MKFKVWLENMEDILGAPSSLSQIGPEKIIYEGTITKLVAPGSTRYLYFLDNQIVSALQIATINRKHYVARVTTLPQFQRKGFATALLTQARKEFKKILPATYLTDAGKNWTNKNF